MNFMCDMTLTSPQEKKWVGQNIPGGDNQVVLHYRICICYCQLTQKLKQ